MPQKGQHKGWKADTSHALIFEQTLHFLILSYAILFSIACTRSLRFSIWSKRTSIFTSLTRLLLANSKFSFILLICYPLSGRTHPLSRQTHLSSIQIYQIVWAAASFPDFCPKASRKFQNLLWLDSSASLSLLFLLYHLQGAKSIQLSRFFSLKTYGIFLDRYNEKKW